MTQHNNLFIKQSKRLFVLFDASLKVHDIRLVTHGEEPKIFIRLGFYLQNQKLSEFELGVEIQRQVYEKNWSL